MNEFLIRGARVLLRVLAAVVVLLVIGALAGLVVVQSGWFHEYVRARIIAELERATGGQVELGRFSFRGPALSAQVAPLVLHGKEAAGEPPLLRVGSVTLGLRIISLFERKIDLASVRVDQPRVRIAIYPDGSTNLPSPGERLGRKSWSEQILDLAVQQYEVAGGLVEIDERRIPLNLRGEGLDLRMSYDARTPAYRGDVNSRSVRVMPAGLAPVETGVSAQFALERTRLVFSRLLFSTRNSRAELAGELQDLREPRGAFTVKANAAVRELVRMFPIPLEPAGSAALDGRLSVAFAKTFRFGITGRVTARGLGYVRDRLQLHDVDLRGDMNLGLDRVSLAHVQATALGAAFTGSASLDHWRDLHAEGTVDALTVAEAAKIVTDRPLPWTGMLAGDVGVEATLGEPTAKVRASLAVSPAGTAPVAGRIAAQFDQGAGTLSLDSSYLATAATRLEASGTLDRELQIQFRSTNLDDILPALEFVEAPAKQEIPLKLLDGGTAVATGSVTGRLENPRFQGQVSVTNASVAGHSFDRFSAAITATRDAVAASRFTLSRGPTEATGSASVTARGGSFEDAALSGQGSLRNVNLAELAKEAGSTVEVMGTASATVRVSGSVRAPEAEIDLDARKLAALGEQIDRLRATARLAPDSLVVTGGDAEAAPARLRFSGSYRHAPSAWKTGEVQFQLAAENLPATRVQTLAKLLPSWDARLRADVRATGRVNGGEFTLTSAGGNLAAQAVTIDGQALGEFALTGQTSGAPPNGGVTVSVTANGKLLEAGFDGQGSWSLEGDEPGSANLRFSRVSLDSFHRLMIMAGAAPREDETGLPFEGFLEGHAAVSLALLRPREAQAEVTLDTVQLNPKATQALQLGVQAQDLVVRNSMPVVVELTPRQARIRSAQFIARDTNLEATGVVPFAAGAGADLSVRGSVNLIILQLLNPNLLARGNATVLASVRGSLGDPSLNGRLELNKASLYLNDVPNGVDNVNGVVLFDRNRATIDKLVAETGGGKVSFSGFVGFGAPLAYRLVAQASQVRVRWPEDVSNTFDANLALNGTSDASTLSGTITLGRAAFNPRTDLVQLLAAAGKPVPASSSPSEYLRGMQFDVRIQNSSNFEFQTSLTRDVQAEVDLRLRGSALRPVLLGTVSVNQGEVQVLGNRYTINRGDIRFLNPVTIEPTLDINLETRARGVTVNISFSGTLQKLNPNYSSDPPLQTSEIIALLAVGRDPSELAGLAAAQSTNAASGLVGTGTGLLSQAVSAQLSSRLQRFFGASRVKIDPTLTGVDNLPQARVTLEQQVSKDITMTYITNLNRTQEQIVRLQWDLDRNWSAVAVRDINGLFGIDFQYRKRFK